MLHFSINRRRQNQQRPATAERRLDLGLDQRPRVKKSLFGRIFASEVAIKETIGGIETLHSASERARHLSSFGALGLTEPGLKRWLEKWGKLGGIAFR